LFQILAIDNHKNTTPRKMQLGISLIVIDSINCICNYLRVPSKPLTISFLQIIAMKFSFSKTIPSSILRYSSMDLSPFVNPNLVSFS